MIDATMPVTTAPPMMIVSQTSSLIDWMILRILRLRRAPVRTVGSSSHRLAHAGISSAGVPVQPVQNRTDTAGGHGNRRVGRTVVKVQSVAVGGDRVAAWKGDVGDVARCLVGRFRSEDPLVAAQQEQVRL